MKVTDAQVEALRALLTGRVDEHRRLLAGLDSPQDQEGFKALAVAAFCDAAERRFKGATRNDVIDFVARVRQRSDRLAAKIDQRAAEQMIVSVITGEDTADIDQAARNEIYSLILPALIIDMSLSGPELDQFLVGARKMADDWLR